MTATRRTCSRTAAGPAALLCVVLSACSTTYVPEASLDGSPRTIAAITEFHPLHLSHKLASGEETFGVDGPNTKNASAKKLTQQIEAALLQELEDARVFSDVTRFDPSPDLVLTGRVNAFHEHYRPALWSYLPYAETAAKFLRLKNYVSSGEASLTLFLLKPSGERIGEFTGRSTFDDSFNPTDTMPPGARLNRALSAALQQIRDQWMSEPQLRGFDRVQSARD